MEYALKMNVKAFSGVSVDPDCDCTTCVIVRSIAYLKAAYPVSEAIIDKLSAYDAVRMCYFDRGRWATTDGSKPYAMDKAPFGGGAYAGARAAHNKIKRAEGPPKSVWRYKSVFRTAKTQKVRGLSAISSSVSYLGGKTNMSSWKFASAQDVLDTPASVDDLTYPFFLRPCPVTPRHGFVDSRIVHTPEEVLSVAVKAVKADPDAELLYTPFIEAEYSAVLTPTTFSLGAGHDGATSGKSNTVYGPKVSPTWLTSIMAKATISAPDVPYWEIVGEDMQFVQVRGGPPLECVVDYVPEDVVVKKVLVATADTDLLQWEKDIASAEAGTVVYADGLSLASHFCVHAVVHKVPVITSYKPRVSHLVKATDVPRWTSQDWRRLARYLTEADRVIAGIGLSETVASIGVAALHLAGTPAPASNAQLRMLAYGAAGALKCIGAACMGEARHVSGSATRPDSASRRNKSVAPVAVVERAGRIQGGGRNQYYAKGGQASLESYKHTLLCLSPVYRHMNWSSSYGGNAWAAINSGARAMAVAISKFRRSPSQKTWAEVVVNWNEAINREHNGHQGAVSKFNIYKSTMDEYAAFPLMVMVRMSHKWRQVIMNGPSDEVLKKGSARIIGCAYKPKNTAKEVVMKVSTAKSVYSKYCFILDDTGRVLVRINRSNVPIEVWDRLITGPIAGTIKIVHRIKPTATTHALSTFCKVLRVDNAPPITACAPSDIMLTLPGLFTDTPVSSLGVTPSQLGGEYQ